MATLSSMEKLHSRVVTSAIHDGQRDDEDYTTACHPGTRETYLEALLFWADNGPLDRRVGWVSAAAGAGKTAMFRSFCTMLEERGCFSPPSFFVWKNDTRRNNLRQFPATIAYSLSRSIPALVPHIFKSLEDDPLLLQSTFKKQMNRLVITPLIKAFDAVSKERHIVIVVDGLDELDTKSQTEFLAFIPDFIDQVSLLPISLLVSSRPETTIVGAFQHPRLASITNPTRLGASDEDIWKFINDKFDDINLRFPYLERENSGKWPSMEKRAIMIKQSSGLFIWPVVAIDYINTTGEGKRHNDRLETVLSTMSVDPWTDSPLDKLYKAILNAHAPKDLTSTEFFRFKRRLALLCLPVHLENFISARNSSHGPTRVVDWTDTPTRVVFEEDLDKVWDSVADLSSLFSPRLPPAIGELPTPTILHRSFRDFVFNRARCGVNFYYSNEQNLHTEIVCKTFNFFNTRQAYYQGCAHMSRQFIDFAGNFLESHLDDASMSSEELGRCMDDVMLDFIPATWPLVAQVHLIGKLYDGVYGLASKALDFPDGSQRCKALLSKVTSFFEKRAAATEEWDLALLRLSHSRAAQCTCVQTPARSYHFYQYHDNLIRSTLTWSAIWPTLEEIKLQDPVTLLSFILSLSETTQRATELSNFIATSDYWILILLPYCPSSEGLYQALEKICTAPLPSLPMRDEDDSQHLVRDFLVQTKLFNEYSLRCRDSQIQSSFVAVKIPKDWWQHKAVAYRLRQWGYRPPASSISSIARDILIESEIDSDDTTEPPSDSDGRSDIQSCACDSGSESSDRLPLDISDQRFVQSDSEGQATAQETCDDQRAVREDERMAEDIVPLLGTALPQARLSPSLVNAPSDLRSWVEHATAVHDYPILGSDTRHGSVDSSGVSARSQRRGFRGFMKSIARW